MYVGIHKETLIPSW